MELRRQTLSQRFACPETLGDGEERQAGRGKDRTFNRFTAFSGNFSSALAEDLRTEANYFEDNKERMRYPKFRKLGFFVGSGVIEAGCKTVMGRLKRSGMFWTVRGANAIIALRCCNLSGRFEQYWEARTA
jgi:hypothetical protein